MERHRLNRDFDKVVCINLAERPDKKQKMDLKFKNLGIDVEWYTAVQYGFMQKIINPIVDYRHGFFNKNHPNEIGAFQSHYSVIKQALIQGCNNILIFEDDCLFHEKFNEILPKYLDSLPNDYDGFLLYSFQSELYKENLRISAKWTKGFKSWSLISYSLNKKAMEKYVEVADKFPQIADLITYNMMNTEFNFYIASPPLIIPSKDESNIRTIKNYETTKSIFLLGINENLYQ